jgi:hypothetical protein
MTKALPKVKEEMVDGGDSRQAIHGYLPQGPGDNKKIGSILEVERNRPIECRLTKVCR